MNSRRPGGGHRSGGPWDIQRAEKALNIRHPPSPQLQQAILELWDVGWIAGETNSRVFRLGSDAVNLNEVVARQRRNVAQLEAEARGLAGPDPLHHPDPNASKRLLRPLLAGLKLLDARATAYRIDVENLPRKGAGDALWAAPPKVGGVLDLGRVRGMAVAHLLLDPLGGGYRELYEAREHQVREGPERALQTPHGLPLASLDFRMREQEFEVIRPWLNRALREAAEGG